MKPPDEHLFGYTEYVRADLHEALQTELAQTRRKALEEAARCAENTPDNAVGTMQLPPSQYDLASAIRALIEKEA